MIYISWKTVTPRFCETLHCFHRILKDVTLPESKTNQKTKPSEMSLILAMSKTGPGLISQEFMSNFGTMSENISRLFQASISSTQKCKKVKSRVLARRGYPGRITEEGGTRRHPRGTHRHQGTQEAPRSLGSEK